MFRAGFILSIVASSLWISAVYAERREAVCFSLVPEAEKDQNAEPDSLCVFSHDLKHFPRSVVSFEFRHLKGSPTVARRHYIFLGDNSFGHRNQREHPQVIFKPESKTVFLGFAAKSRGAVFRYQHASGDIALLPLAKAPDALAKRVEAGPQRHPAENQTSRSDTPQKH